MDFSELYEKNFDKIYSYVRCRLRTDAAAEDVSSAVFGKAFECFSQYDPARGESVQWLFGIARNEVNYHLRRSVILNFLPLDLFGDIFSEKLHDRGDTSGENVRELCAALKELDAKEQDLIALKFYSGLNNRQIAAMTSISESNVGTILYRCMGKLRRKLVVEGL
jgi:RNA polymerase sigma-70 factor (ECF subfamily)